MLRFEGDSELTRMIFESDERDDLSRVAIGLLSHLQNLPELQDLVAFVRQEDWLREEIFINTPQQQVLEAGHAWWITTTIGLPLLTHYLEEAGTGEWDPETFRRLFADFAVHPTEDTVPISITAPLSNLESPLDEIRFGDDLVIRRLTPEDKSQLWERVASDPLPNPLLRVEDLAAWSHAITARARVPKRPLDLTTPWEK